MSMDNYPQEDEEKGYGETPEGFRRCGICGQFHKVDFHGDCRNDAERYVWDDSEEEDVLISSADMRRRQKGEEG